MALSIAQQYNIGISAISRGDVDLMQKLLTDPDAVTIAEQRSVAEKLGIKKGFLSAMVNTAADPTVWLAYWMSNRFPTSAWLNGTVPKRYNAGNAEFSGLSFVARPIEGFFPGTNVPRMAALSQYRFAEVMKSGQKMFSRFQNRPNWKTEMPVVSQLLEGIEPPGGANPELRALAGNIRQDMNGLWGFLKQTHRVEGGFDGGEITRSRSRAFTQSEAPKFLRDYLPHIPQDGGPMTVSGTEALKNLLKGDTGRHLKAKGIGIQDIWNVKETDRLSSNFSRYQELLNRVEGQVFNRHLFKRERFNVNLQSGGDLFVTDLNVVLQRYLTSVARTFSTNAPISEFERRMLSKVGVQAPTLEPLITQITNEGLAAGRGQFSTRSIPGTKLTRDVLIPGTENAPQRTALRQLVRNLQGMQGEDEIFFGNAFSGIRKKLWDMGKSGRMKDGEVRKVDALLEARERDASFRQKTNGLTSFFYSSTLGLNFRSAMQNMLQPFLTTAPAIGMGSTFEGMKLLKTRMPAYMRGVREEMQVLKGNQAVRAGALGESVDPKATIRRFSIAAERSFEKTFPELASSGIKTDPRLFDIDEKLLGQSFGQARFTKMDDLNRALLQPFTHTEMANRITTFYGAKDALRKSIRSGEFLLPSSPKTGTPFAGQELESLLNFEAGQVVSATQFAPGPGTRSVFQNYLPSPLRMFTSFPTRLFSYFADSTVRGAMSNQALADARILNTIRTKGLSALNPASTDPVVVAAQQKALSLGTGRNVGAIARTYLYSKIIVNGLRDTIGVDVGGALGLVAPFQVAPPDQMFAPLPMPPVAGVAVGLFSAATTRDSKRLQPFNMPGFGEIPFLPKSLVPGGVAITRFARALQQFKPDAGGFVDEDERLMYRGGTPELLMTALGVPLDKSRRTRDIMERVQSNRSRVRQFRRRYANAALNADSESMVTLRAQYEKTFPDMPPLSVTRKDLSRYRDNARLPMVQRMIRTMGKSASFLEADIYEFDPDLLAPQEPGLAGALR